MCLQKGYIDRKAPERAQLRQTETIEQRNPTKLANANFYFKPIFENVSYRL